VIGAHYDCAPEGEGIIDDWIGASMLASLHQSLKGRPRKHTFVFVAFAKKETGLEGSRRYVPELGKDGLKHVRAFVNLERLATSPMKVGRAGRIRLCFKNSNGWRRPFIRVSRA